jgi:hypothetical protein
MDKPLSLSVKDYIIRKMSVKLMVSENVIESVVNHQFKSTIDAISNGSNRSVEVGGLGKFLFNTKKAYKKLDSLLSIKSGLEKRLQEADISETRKRNAVLKLESANSDIELLKPKIQEYEPFSNLRRVEEQPSSPSAIEGEDKTSL